MVYSVARRGEARRGVGYGEARCMVARRDKTRRDEARCGMARQDEAKRGEAKRDVTKRGEAK